MTAEIAIMNKSGVALAADSAVTLRQRTGLKVYRSTNKLFPLADNLPVGVMAYGNALIMGVPWDTIVKLYADRLGKKSYDTLEEYISDFINFLEQEKGIFPAKVQENHLRRVVAHFLNNVVKRDIEKQMKAIISKSGKIENSELKNCIREAINKVKTSLDKAKGLPHIPVNFGRKVVEKNNALVIGAIKEIFKNLPLDELLTKSLEEVVVLLLDKDLFVPDVSSGIVIAGFGNEEIFPSVQSILIEGIIENKLKWKNYKGQKINFDVGSSIIPFAQIDMVYTFMEGLDPLLDSYIRNSVENLMTELPNKVIEVLKIKDDEEGRKKLASALKDATDKFLLGMKNQRKTYHTNPVINAISAQPPYELALLAESLINLTSLKQRVTLDVETVGGPVDVALITKIDGFVWVKRKPLMPQEFGT
jgi:hypothetical protein